MEVEIIDFREPENAQLYVTKIKWLQAKVDLVEMLQDRFSHYGLIHFINTNQDEYEHWYAYINFYSTRAAKRALRDSQCLVINSQQCKVTAKKREMLKKGRPLYLNQCEDLANYYLGFSGWSSQILYHQKEDCEKDKITYATAVKLSFPSSGTFVEGVGMSTAQFSSLQEKMSKICMAQKLSRNAAVINAFVKTFVVLVYENAYSSKFKAAVRFDPSHKDPFYYDSIWDEANKPLPMTTAESDFLEDDEFESLLYD